MATGQVSLSPIGSRLARRTSSSSDVEKLIVCDKAFATTFPYVPNEILLPHVLSERSTKSPVCIYSTIICSTYPLKLSLYSKYRILNAVGTAVFGFCLSAFILSTNPKTNHGEASQPLLSAIYDPSATSTRFLHTTDSHHHWCKHRPRSRDCPIRCLSRSLENNSWGSDAVKKADGEG